MSYATGTHEHAFPEHKKAGFTWGLEAGRNLEDVWQNDQSPVVPTETLQGFYAPTPRLKLALGVIGTGVGGQAKVVMGARPHWASAVVGRLGWVNGDDRDPWSNVRTWKANGLVAELDAVLSVGTDHPAHPTKRDILFAASMGPKLIYTYLAYERLASGDGWRRSVVDYGAFVGVALERWFFRFTAEISVLRVDRPSHDSHELRPFGGGRLHFSW